MVNAVLDCAEIYGILATAAGCAPGVTVQKALLAKALAKVRVQAVVAEPNVILPELELEPLSIAGEPPQLDRVGLLAAEVSKLEKV